MNNNKKEKEVHYKCPNQQCTAHDTQIPEHITFPKPIQVMQQNGTVKEQQTIKFRNCPHCGTGLTRRVKKQ